MSMNIQKQKKKGCLLHVQAIQPVRVRSLPQRKGQREDHGTQEGEQITRARSSAHKQDEDLDRC